MSAGLELIDIVKRFGSQTVVDRASLTIAPGEIVALLGPSGCGKTTTLRMIAGFEKLDGGRIALGSTDIADLPIFRRRIGLVFQDYALFPHMTVAQNVDYGMRQQGIAAGERDKRRAELLRLVRLDGLDARYPAGLSGGQQQRVARALAIVPNLLLLDGPLSNLDAKLRETLRIELRQILRSIGMTTLVVTHDQQEAIGIADRIAVMQHGRIAQIGTAREIYEEPLTRFVAEFIGHSLWFAGKLETAGSAREVGFRSDDGTLFIATSAAVPVERPGLAIRPEHIHLRARPDDTNRIPAVVDRIEFFGAELILHCRLKGSGRILAIPSRTDEPDLPKSGDDVELGISAARCRVVADV